MSTEQVPAEKMRKTRELRLLISEEISEAGRSFWSQVAADSNGCITWIGTPGSNGYGVFYFAGRHHRVHRFVYLLSGRKLSSGEVVDHICKNRRCVNINHLRVVSNRQNVLENSVSLPALNLAKTHCIRGHAFTEGNTRYRSDGARACRTCAALRWREKYRRLKGDLYEPRHIARKY